jgi:hypothetical protein
MRTRYAAILSVAAVLLGACSSGSSGVGPTDTTSGNGAPPPVARPAFRPMFQPGDGILPYPTDLFVNGSVDGTVNFPTLAVTPNGASVNALDGFGVNGEITVRFSMPIDAATLAAPGAVTVLETTMRTVVASSSSIARVPIGVRRVLLPGVDYSVGVSTAADARGQVLSIKPLKPLTPSSGGALDGAPLPLVDDNGVGYLVILTAAIQATDGTPAAPDNDYAGIKQAIGANPLAPSPGCSAIPSATGAALCQATVPQLAIAAGAHIPLSAVTLTFSFTTQSTRDALVEMAGEIMDVAAPALVAQGLPNGAGGLLTTKNLLDPTNSIPFLVGNADVYEGTLTLPYYLPTPADATAAMPAPPLTGQWLSADAVSLVPGQAGSHYITRYNPVPAVTHTIPVPVLITIPNARPRPVAGWPVVIFVHGITRNRTDALAIAEAYATAGIAVAAIDLPLHGLPPTGATAALRIPNLPERTFDVDYINNTTGVPPADGIVDGSGRNFIQIASPITSRDNLRQGVLDQLSLARALGSPDTAIVGTGGPLLAPFNPDAISLSGQSLGGIVGATVASLDSNITDFAFSVPGGLITDLLLNSQTFGPPIGGGVAAQLGPDTLLYRAFFRDAQAAVDAGDPINHFAIAAAAKPVLLQKVVGDTVVPNIATDRLITVGGLTKITSAGSKGPRSYVTFTTGNHGSLLDPTASAQLTVEMQREFVYFAASHGGGTLIVDPTYVESTPTVP